MSRALTEQICAALPGATAADPTTELDSWKVGGKMFACIGTADTGVSVKTPDIETAQMLIEAGAGIKAPYFHRSWIHLPWPTEEADLTHRLAVAYDTIRAGLAKKVQASLPPRRD